MTVEDIKEYRYKHWRDDLPVEEAYKEYIKEGEKMNVTSKELKAGVKGYNKGKKDTLDELEEWANNFLFIPRHSIKKKISTMRLKP